MTGGAGGRGRSTARRAAPAGCLTLAFVLGLALPAAPSAAAQQVPGTRSAPAAEAAGPVFAEQVPGTGRNPAATGDSAAHRRAAEDLRQRARRILEEPGYQTEMPDLADLPDLPRLPALGPLAELLLRVLLLLFAAALLWLLIYVIWDFVRQRQPSPLPESAPLPSPSRSLEPAPAAPRLPDAEVLARAGRFGDAVHALLLHALVALARHRGSPLPVSWTSREVLRGLDLEAEPRGALLELVAAVERYLFAGLPLGAEDWERCRSAYLQLAGGETA